VPTVNLSRKQADWLLGIGVFLFSSASAITFLGYIGQGITVGSLIGQRGRENDVLVYQQRATYWFAASLACEIFTVACLVPLMRFASNDSPVVGFGERLGRAIIAAPLLTWLVGDAMLSLGRFVYKRF
jgi:hypothetical protein